MILSNHNLLTKEPGNTFYSVDDDFSQIPFFSDRDRVKFNRVIDNKAKAEFLLKNEPLPLCVSAEYVERI